MKSEVHSNSLVPLRDSLPTKTESLNKISDMVAETLFELLKWRAEHGDIVEQYKLGLWCEYGYRCPEDIMDSVMWYRIVADVGYTCAQMAISNHKKRFPDYEKEMADHEKARKDFSQKWKAMDESERDEWIKLRRNLSVYIPPAPPVYASDKEHIESFELNTCFDKFVIEGAKKMLRMADEQGGIYLQYALGSRYNKAQGYIKNKSEAVKWYRMAAEQSFKDVDANSDETQCFYIVLARIALATLYARDELDESVFWYIKTAELNSSQFSGVNKYISAACFELSRIYSRNCDTFIHAIKWIRKVAETGDPTAQILLGLFYYNGRGVEEDKSEAYLWLLRAAEQGSQDALSLIDSYYK